jgi:plastocyanin
VRARSSVGPSIRRIANALILLAVTAAACGSGGGSAATSAPPAAGSSSGGDCAALAGLTGSVQDDGSSAVSGTSVEIDAGDFFFDPTCLTASSAGTIAVTVTNTGNALHNFTVEEQGIDQDVQVGESITVKVKLPASGALPFLCKYHVGSGMQGAFVVG